MLKRNSTTGAKRSLSRLIAGLFAGVALCLGAGETDPYARSGNPAAQAPAPVSAPAAAQDAASLDRLYPRVAERSGNDHITWDLGPATGEPDKHQYLTALVGMPGTWGGYQCNRGANPGTGFNANPFTGVYVGEYTTATPPYTCTGYIRWELGSALPATAQITTLQLTPLNVVVFAGAARTQDIHLVDVNNTPSLPYANAYNVAIYNDFNAMFGGRDEYGLTNASATGSLTVNLNHQAVQDANDRLRASPYGYFAVGFYSSPQPPGNYLQLSSSASTMTVGYTDYVPNQVVINYLAVRPALSDYEVDLYNYGENIDIGGWIIHSINASGLNLDFTIPGSFVLPRHGRVRLLATSGVNTFDKLYMGFSPFNWGTPDVRLFLERADSSLVDFVCWGAPPAPPAGAGWQGPCVASLATAYYDVRRVRDSDTDGAGDWITFNNLFLPNPAMLMTGQTGSRRRSDVFFNQFDTYLNDSWLEILNDGPDTNLLGWSVRIYSQSTGVLDGIYTFPNNPLLSGELVWLKQNNNWGAGQTNLRRNLGFTVNWTLAPTSGEAILFDAAGRARDTVIFGKPRVTHTPAEIPWIGPFVTVGATANEDRQRDTDLNLNGAGNWVAGATGNVGVLNPNQRGPLLLQDEIGIAGGTQVLNINGASGAGDVITVTQQVGLESFSIEAAPIDAPRTGSLVVKKQGAASIFFSRAVTVSGPGISQTHSGLINPPLVLDPGTYAVMLYLDGAWYDNQLAGSTERLSFGTVGGVTFENGVSPTTAFSVNAAGSAAHAHLNVLYPPVVTGTPPTGEVSVPYNFTYTSTGGYGAARTWSIISGSLPPGLVMSTAGVVSGTPTTGGSSLYTVQVTDGIGLKGSRADLVFVNSYIAITTTTLPAGAVSVSYSNNMTASGGVGPNTWTVDSGLLPGGLTITGATIGGTPQAAGTFNFVVRVTDSYGATDTQALSIVITQPLMILNTGLPVGVITVPYPAFSLAAAGGVAPYSYSLSAGTMPAGMVLNGNGSMGGTPTTAGSTAVIFQVTDSASPTPGTATRALTFTISNPPTLPAWKPRGLDGGNLFLIAVSPNNETDNTVYVSGRAGEVYATHDQGLGWSSTIVKTDQANPTLNALVLSPSFDYNSLPADPVERKTIFVTTFEYGVYKSTDFGLSFSPVNAGLPCFGAPCPIGGIPYLHSLAISPDYLTSRTLWVAAVGTTNVTEIYRSTNAGASWTLAGSVSLPPFSGQIASLAVSPDVARDHTLYLAAGGDLYRSLNDGAGWNLVLDPGIDGVKQVVISPDYPIDHTVLTRSSSLWRSQDAGANFVPVTPGVVFNSVTELTAYPRAGLTPRWVALKFANNYGALLTSDDSFTSYTPAYASGLKSVDYGSIGLSRQLAGGGVNLFLAGNTRNGGVNLSTDDGFSFEERDQGVHSFIYTSICGNGSVVAGINPNYWFKSGDAGQNWVKLDPTIGTINPQNCAFSPDYPNDHLHLVGGGVGVRRTADGGQTFTTSTGISSSVSQLVYYPGFSGGTGEVWAGTQGNGIRRSFNGGVSFSGAAYVPGGSCPLTAFSYIGAILFSPNYASDSTIFVSGRNSSGGSDTMCKTVNGGVNWIALSNGPNSTGAAMGISPNYIESGANGTPAKTLFAYGVDFSLNQGAIYRSTDGGATWNKVAANLYGNIAVSPLYNLDGTVFVYNRQPAAGSYSLWRGTASGTSFAPLGAADLLKTRGVTGLYFPPGFDGRNSTNSPAVVTTFGSGIWRSDDGGRSFSAVTGYKFLNDTLNDIIRVPGGALGITAGGKTPTRGPRLPDAVSAGTLLAATTGQGVFQSDDGGLTFSPLSAGLPANADARAVIAPSAATTAPVTAVANAGSAGIYRYNGSAWALAGGAPVGNFTRFLEFPQPVSGSYLYATRADGRSVRSSDNGASWTAQDVAQPDLVYADYNATTLPTVAGRPPPGKISSSSPDGVTGTSAALWSVSQTAGARYSINSGSTWLAATGSGDYVLPATGNYTTVRALGINPANSFREVLVGHSTLGLYKTGDGGDKWYNMTGPGSGLEATSKNAGAMITTVTPAGTTDILLGLIGSTTGGVYLSGDGGEHWMQINQGFDPNNLNITTLAKTSCTGCPVQYYSGTYGSGVYTRTIPVNPEPAITGWCFTGAGCACAAAAGSGPQQGGQAFKLCGSNFAALAKVEFDGIPASGCTITVPSVISCTATPAHVPGLVSVRVRNTDTRDGYISPDIYAYTAGVPRIANLRVAKSGSDAALTWSCGTCGTVTAGVTRSQNALFNLNVETYIGGTTGSWTNTGALAAGTNSTYFWNVE